MFEFELSRTPAKLAGSAASSTGTCFLARYTDKFAAALESGLQMCTKNARPAANDDLYSTVYAVNMNDIHLNAHNLPTSRAPSGALACRFVLLCVQAAGYASAPFVRGETGKKAAGLSLKSDSEPKTKPKQLAKLLPFKNEGTDGKGVNALVQWSYEKKDIPGDRGDRVDAAPWVLVPGDVITFWYTADDIKSNKLKVRMQQEEGKPVYAKLPVHVDFVPAGTVCKLHLTSKRSSAEAPRGISVRSVSLASGQSLGAFADCLDVFASNVDDSMDAQMQHVSVVENMPKDLSQGVCAFYVRGAEMGAPLTLVGESADAASKGSSSDGTSIKLSLICSRDGMRVQSAFGVEAGAIESFGILQSIAEKQEFPVSGCVSLPPRVIVPVDKCNAEALDVYVPSTQAMGALNCGTIRSCARLMEVRTGCSLPCAAVYVVTLQVRDMQVAASSKALGVFVMFDKYATDPICRFRGVPCIDPSVLFSALLCAEPSFACGGVQRSTCPLREIAEELIDGDEVDAFDGVRLVDEKDGVSTRALDAADKERLCAMEVGKYMDVYLPIGLDAALPVELLANMGEEELAALIAAGAPGFPRKVVHALFRMLPLYVYSVDTKARALVRDFPLVDECALKELQPHYSFDVIRSFKFGNVVGSNSGENARVSLPPLALYETVLSVRPVEEYLVAYGQSKGWYGAVRQNSSGVDRWTLWHGYLNCTALSLAEALGAPQGGVASGVGLFAPDMDMALPLKRKYTRSLASSAAIAAAVCDSAAADAGAAPVTLYCGLPPLLSCVAKVLALHGGEQADDNKDGAAELSD